MRIAAFNVENLFERARALNSDEWVEQRSSDPSRWAPGRAVLDAFGRTNALLQRDTYGPTERAAILEGLRALGLERSDQGPFARLQRIRGRLLRRPRAGGAEIVASGRGDWIGWIELLREPVNEVALANTARILREVNADIVAVVEADDRTSLSRFNGQMLPAVDGTAYAHVRLLDGNDARGIDVGLLARPGLEPDILRTHVDDRDARGERVFSRDCPEYHLRMPGGATIILLPNHFKSKGGGGLAASNARRLAQSRRVREIYEELRAGGEDNVVVLGDLNDTPDSPPLAPLLFEGSDLRDVSAHPAFDDGGRPGTFGNSTARDKIDYILLSPTLFGRMRAGGIERRGVWGGRNGTLWPVLPELTRAVEAASDHAALWADLDLD